MPEPTRTVEHEIRIDARPETVFAYFTDPARMVRWMGTEATLDPRPGGIFQVTMRRDVGEASIQGRYVEIEPARRVVFTWGYAGDLLGVPPETTRVDVRLEPEAGGTRVRIRHTSLPAESVEDHVAGWLNYFARLQVAAEGGDPGPDEFVVPTIARAVTRDS